MANNQSKEELEKKRAGLETAAMQMAIQGLAIPSEIETELQQITNQLSGLESSTAPSTDAWRDWLGKSIEGYQISERISSGSYSHLFRASKGDSQCAIKISKSPKPISINRENHFVKRAFQISGEITTAAEISGNSALKAEFEKLQLSLNQNFIPTFACGETEGHFYYCMPYLEGQSLLDLMSAPEGLLFSFGTEVLAQLADLVDSFAPGQYHGNITPDSIFITKNDIVLLSPGNFSATTSSGSTVALTTPSYYPFMEPNDIFSIGCCLWQVLLKQHPLSSGGALESPDRFAQDLREMLNYRKALNHAPLWHFLKLTPPNELRSDLNSETIRVLMRALKLEYDHDGYITASAGYKSGKSLAVDLEHLSKNEIAKKKL